MAIFSDNFNDGTFNAWTSISGFPVIRCCNGTDNSPAFCCCNPNTILTKSLSPNNGGNLSCQLAYYPSGLSFGSAINDFYFVFIANATDLVSSSSVQSFYVALNGHGTVRIGRFHFGTPFYEWHEDSSPGSFPFDGNQHGFQVGFTYSLDLVSIPQRTLLTASVAVDNSTVLSITNRFCGWHNLLGDSLPDTWDGFSQKPGIDADIWAVDDVSAEGSGGLISKPAGNANTLTLGSCTAGIVRVTEVTQPSDLGGTPQFWGFDFDGSTPGPGGTSAGSGTDFVGGIPPSPWYNELAFDGTGFSIAPQADPEGWTLRSFTVSNGDDPDNIAVCPGEVVVVTATHAHATPTPSITDVVCADTVLTITGVNFNAHMVITVFKGDIAVPSTVLSITSTEIRVQLQEIELGAEYRVSVS